MARRTSPRAATSIRSILGECSGNVRSTPTPNDCLRTVKVSRTPWPWRLITTPSNTCVRRRVPSITWKWTRRRSPASNAGTRRSWVRSRLSIAVLISGYAARHMRMAGRPARATPRPVLRAQRAGPMRPTMVADVLRCDAGRSWACATLTAPQCATTRRTGAPRLHAPGSARGATARSARGGPTTARPARASHGSRPDACSGGTRAPPRAQR